MRGNQKQRWTSLCRRGRQISLHPSSPPLLPLMFASFSRFLSNLGSLLTFSLSLSPPPLTSHSLRDKGAEETLAEVGWSYRWKFPRLAISVQSASHPSVCLRILVYIRGRDVSKVEGEGWNSIQTNLTLARLLKPEGCFFFFLYSSTPFFLHHLKFLIKPEYSRSRNF